SMPRNAVVGSTANMRIHPRHTRIAQQSQVFVEPGLLATHLAIAGHDGWRLLVERQVPSGHHRHPHFRSVGRRREFPNHLNVVDMDVRVFRDGYERALALDPTNLDVLRNAVLFLAGLGRLDEALVLDEAIIPRDPVNLTALSNLGNAQREA